MSKHITVAEWELAGEFTKAAEPGDTVDEEIVDNFLNVMPPPDGRDLRPCRG